MSTEQRLAALEATVATLAARASVTAEDVAAAVSPQGAPPAEVIDYVSKMMGMHRMPDDERTRLREANLAAYNASLNKFWPGNVAVGELTVEDKAYLAAMAGPYQDRTGQDLRFAGAIGGWFGEINSAFRDGTAWRNNYPADKYTGKMKAIVEAMMGGG